MTTRSPGLVALIVLSLLAGVIGLAWALGSLNGPGRTRIEPILLSPAPPDEPSTSPKAKTTDGSKKLGGAKQPNQTTQDHKEAGGGREDRQRDRGSKKQKGNEAQDPGSAAPAPAAPAPAGDDGSDDDATGEDDGDDEDGDDGDE